MALRIGHSGGFGKKHLFVRGGGGGRGGGICTPMKTKKKTKKKRITKSAVTPTYGGFRRLKLDTVAGSAMQIFLCEGIVQGRSIPGVLLAKRILRLTTHL